MKLWYSYTDVHNSLKMLGSESSTQLSILTRAAPTVAAQKTSALSNPGSVWILQLTMNGSLKGSVGRGGGVGAV